MIDLELRGIKAFIEVAQNESFSAAAQRLMVSPAAISQMIRQLEDRLQAKLLTRTTRRVSLTEAGMAFLSQCKPALEMIAEASVSVSSLQAQPTGLLRITTSRLAAQLYIEPHLRDFLREQPQLSVEINIDDSLTDVVKEKFDLGIRTAGFVEKDMVAINLKPMRLLVCGTPEYLKTIGRPKKLEDLEGHNCIRYRSRSSSRLMGWEFRKADHDLELAVNGNTIVNETQLMKALTLNGVGLSQLVEDDVATLIEEKKLESVLDKFSIKFDGFQLFYPNKRFLPAKVRAFIDFLVKRVRLKK